MKHTPDLSTVTVYLPTRNRSALARRAIASVLAQSYQSIELIIVDDFSDDDTEIMARQCIAENSTAKIIKYVRLGKKSGAAAARNEALLRANGYFFTGLDDDDFFLPDRISRLVAAFEPRTCSFVFDGYQRETHLASGRVRRVIVPLRKGATLRDILKRNIVGNQTLTLTSRIRDLGGFDVRLPAWQDHDLWIRLVRQFGDAKPAQGISYVHTEDASRPRISNDAGKASRAFDIFLEKHVEYADAELLLCLRLARMCYGAEALTAADIPALFRLGEPRYVAFALCAYLTKRWSRKIVL